VCIAGGAQREYGRRSTPGSGWPRNRSAWPRSRPASWCSRRWSP